MNRLVNNFGKLKLDHCKSELLSLIKSKNLYLSGKDAKVKEYNSLVTKLPDIEASYINLESNVIKIGHKSDLTLKQYEDLFNSLKAFHPWRKGPFEIFDIYIDSEWCSYLKWNRLKDHITPLVGKRVLDIGSSCGYYLFKMALSQPTIVLGIEPYLIFYFQYKLLQHFIKAPDIYCIPAKLEEMPVFNKYFDTVFCMGILYHRKSPIETLKSIYDNMRKGGELIIETLVIEGDLEIALFPEDRYGKMRNVYFIPTVNCLTSWLKRVGFVNIRCIDVTPTTLDEQRKTEWIQTESLADFLDPKDFSKTVEGYPAPVRAILIANV